MPDVLIDSHAHLTMREFDGDRAGVIKRAQDAGVKYIINAEIGRAHV
jgi:Tat protein secretion system quality control protein TatD with DNase activity